MNTKITLFALMVVASVSAQAATVYGIDNLGTNNAGTIGDRLVSFDSANPSGTVTTVGSTGIAATLMGGLAFDNAGNLYCASQNAAGNLYSVSTVNGAASLIGGSGLELRDLAWDSVNNRMLGLRSTGIVSLDLSTGAATPLVTITGGAGPLWIGMTVNAAGNVFLHDIASDFMFTVDMGTGAATQMSAGIGQNTNFSQGMGTNWSGNDQWLLGAIGNTPAFFSTITDINPATGAGTIISTFPNNGPGGLPQYELGDLDFVPVPEPFSMIALGAGVLALARRRRSK